MNKDAQQLILVQGAAGTGKTVLLSSLFYDLFQGGSDRETDVFDYQNLNSYLLVNHDEQLQVYQTIARRLLIEDAKNPRVMKPTKFINEHDPHDEPVDVVLIDEAHLLWTQGKQSYRGENQLKDIMQRARIVVAIFDPAQALAGNQYWDEQNKAWLDKHETITLKGQMRIDSDGPACQWIEDFGRRGVIGNIPSDDKYQIKIFSSPNDLHEAIRLKATDNSEVENGISRLLATYDWPYNANKKKEDDGSGSKTWDVVIGDWAMPWNYQVEFSYKEKVENRGRSWAEKKKTINEVGSIFTIQGFDLNYAGVIIGPSVKFRDGKVVFDRDASHNQNVTKKRTISDGSKVELHDELLQNQLNVLLTRGVHGLYIYAVDEELQAELLRAQNRLL
ncbi:DUF2075 domain-containing protein [Corynebacterium sp. sy039]|uniref:DUF2075 domain-containing protein n=1 Tax=Corynebacterium sp. sy039 TaxID=2599641 RepID=UPI001AEFE44B|nr:DUF2075 domain-containing protein [Corynebacterium sp. sy039]